MTTWELLEYKASALQELSRENNLPLQGRGARQDRTGGVASAESPLLNSRRLPTLRLS